MNAAGIQFFGNCITNAAKLPHAVQKEIYTALTGHRHHPKVDAVTVVSVLGAVSRKTARSWHRTLEETGWSAGFTVGTPESCLASTQEAEMVDMDALPEVLPAVVDAVKSGESTQIIASVCVEETNPLRVAANVAAIQPAVGGGAVVAAPAIAALGRHWQRHATGLSLPRLLDLFRKQYTAEVIYEAFKSVPLLVSKKKRGSSRSCPPATWCTTLPSAY